MKKTVTTIFMVPTLQVGKDYLFENGFINAFIKDKDKEDIYENAVYLLFKPSNLDKFRNFLENEYERTKQIIEDYDHEDGFVVVVYKLDEKFEKDFNLIKLGKYSKTSEEFQIQFPEKVKVEKNNRIIEELSLQYRIFNKTPDMIEYWEERLNINFKEDMEVWRDFNIDEETLNIEVIKEEILN